MIKFQAWLMTAAMAAGGPSKTLTAYPALNVRRSVWDAKSPRRLWVGSYSVGDKDGAWLEAPADIMQLPIPHWVGNCEGYEMIGCDYMFAAEAEEAAAEFMKNLPRPTPATDTRDPRRRLLDAVAAAGAAYEAEVAADPTSETAWSILQGI